MSLCKAEMRRGGVVDDFGEQLGEQLVADELLGYHFGRYFRHRQRRGLKRNSFL